MLGKGRGGLYKARIKEDESERLRGERDQIQFTGLIFERWQVVRFRKARMQDHTLGMNDDL